MLKSKKRIVALIIVFVFIILEISSLILYNHNKKVEKDNVKEQIKENKELEEEKNIKEETDEKENNADSTTEEIKNNEVKIKEEEKTSNDKNNTSSNTSDNTPSSKFATSSSNNVINNNSNSTNNSNSNNSSSNQNTNPTNETTENIWDKLGMTEYQYYNEPMYSWEHVDFSVNTYGSESAARNACLNYGDNYQPYLNGEVLYHCTTVNSASGKYLGEMFHTEELIQ